ncbi:hypothetical protein JOB18_017944 [Solea senegalensis]|uniref:Uncharacterized protein n=1 Tax=Solea senegalensis TaxID=28829 RepID=A0AAV6RXJ9_SOLSE|nr:hypothetical protein JOB18_017944 [Solea senegalensis]
MTVRHELSWSFTVITCVFFLVFYLLHLLLLLLLHHFLLPSQPCDLFLKGDLTQSRVGGQREVKTDNYDDDDDNNNNKNNNNNNNKTNAMGGPWSRQHRPPELVLTLTRLD